MEFSHGTKGFGCHSLQVHASRLAVALAATFSLWRATKTSLMPSQANDEASGGHTGRGNGWRGFRRSGRHARRGSQVHLQRQIQ